MGSFLGEKQVCLVLYKLNQASEVTHREGNFVLAEKLSHVSFILEQ